MAQQGTDPPGVAGVADARGKSVADCRRATIDLLWRRNLNGKKNVPAMRVRYGGTSRQIEIHQVSEGNANPMGHFVYVRTVNKRQSRKDVPVNCI